jgi:hypothetical protein
MRSKIVSVTRDDDGFVHLQVQLEGKVVAGAKYGEAKSARMTGELILKPVVADDIKIGSVITVEVNDEEPGERIE